MPCYTPSYVHSKGDAILCSIFRKAEAEGVLTAMIDGLDYALIGVPKDQVWRWWEDHKAADAKELKRTA